MLMAREMAKWPNGPGVTIGGAGKKRIGVGAWTGRDIIIPASRAAAAADAVFFPRR